MTQENTPAATGPITFDDVKKALGEVSPFETNAGKLQAIIGRGSNQTVQKHLDALREQYRLAAARAAGGIAETPKAPGEVVDALWTAAWSAAQTLTLARLEQLTVEREGLRTLADAQAADLDALAARLDNAESVAAQAVADLAKAQVKEEAQGQAAAAAAQEQSAALAAAQVEITRIVEAAAAASAIATRDAQIERHTMQTTINQLTDQLSELKAMRIVMVQQSQEPAAEK